MSKQRRIRKTKKLSFTLLIITLLFLSCSCGYISDKNNSAENTQELDENINKEDKLSLELILKVLSKTIQNELTKNKELKLSEFLNSDDNFESMNRDYGFEEFIDVDFQGFTAYVVYPQGNLKELDKACKKWVDNTIKTYQNEIKTFSKLLLIKYNSHIVDNSYVVVEFNGEFYSSIFAPPIPIFASFNADLNTGKVLSIQTFLKPKELNKLKEHIIKATGLDEHLVDAELLNNWEVSDGGIGVALEKSKYFPGSLGVVKVFSSYDMLKEKNKRQGTRMIKLKKGEKVIALTFDDGPGAHTPRLLDILKNNNVRATFFVLGCQIDTNPDLLPRMIEEGHEIGGHSWTHPVFNNLSDEALTKEIMRTREKITSLTGFDVVSVRPPYGAYNSRVKAVGKSLGVHFVNWNVDPVDWKTRNAQMTYNAIMRNVDHGDIILCHDTHCSTVDAMETLIPRLLAEGYRFVTVSELLMLGNGEIQPGEVYFSIDIKR